MVLGLIAAGVGDNAMFYSVHLALSLHPADGSLLGRAMDMLLKLYSLSACRGIIPLGTDFVVEPFYLFHAECVQGSY